MLFINAFKKHKYWLVNEIYILFISFYRYMYKAIKKKKILVFERLHTNPNISYHLCQYHLSPMPISPITYANISYHLCQYHHERKQFFNISVLQSNALYIIQTTLTYILLSDYIHILWYKVSDYIHVRLILTIFKQSFFGIFQVITRIIRRCYIFISDLW